MRILALGSLILGLASIAGAQTASLRSEAKSIVGGSTVKLTAAVAYEDSPPAVGWSIELPEGWTYSGSSGPNRPQVEPPPGATGALEWAYTAVPAGGARFVVNLKASNNPEKVHIRSHVYLRRNGRQTTIELEPVEIVVRP